MNDSSDNYKGSLSGKRQELFQLEGLSEDWL